MNDGSKIAVGVLNDSETSQRIGINARAMTTKFATPQPAFCRGGVIAAMSGSPLPDVGAGGRGANAPDEESGDDRHADEDKDRDGRADAEVQRVEQVVVTEDR